eukprot:Phypoly_transcript_09039.p2 GENE.Phypoly_transcript_09039~~Phypoly_transcript_09039.p2  ORF type:complete len:109 (-),score=6.76 Phypoly_transcript_09039:1021-1347(-)
MQGNIKNSELSPQTPNPQDHQHPMVILHTVNIALHTLHVHNTLPYHECTMHHPMSHNVMHNITQCTTHARQCNARQRNAMYCNMQCTTTCNAQHVTMCAMQIIFQKNM